MDTFPGWFSFCLFPSCTQKRADLCPNNLELHQQLVSKHCCRAQEPAEMCFETSQGEKKSLEGWFWKLLSVGGAESVLELVGSGRKTFTIGDLCAEKLIIYNM